MKYLLILLFTLGLCATAGGDNALLNKGWVVRDSSPTIISWSGGDSKWMAQARINQTQIGINDSLTARVGRLEKRAKPTLFEEVAGFLLGGLIGLGFWGWINGLVHKHKKWMEVHK